MARVYLVAGLGFGDEGKGSIVDFLTRSTGAQLVVRYNGGAQAGHNVVLPDGRHHCFSQVGSGTFVPGVRTFLSKHMLVNPLFMYSEVNHLLDIGVTDAWERIVVDQDALVTNPFQVAANRLRELYRGDGRHGSCGMGIGETVSDSLTDPDALRVGDLREPDVTNRKLRRSQEQKIAELTELKRNTLYNARLDVEWAILQDRKWPSELAHGLYRDWTRKVQITDSSYLTSRMNGEGVIIFEGAQGVLLDENFGFHPYTTWSTTTFKNAEELLVGHSDPSTRVGVLRTYMTRHGAGPFPTEDANLKLPGEHNSYSEWQQGFRVGYFDAVLMEYALGILGKVDFLALTHLDAAQGSQQVCTSYDIDDDTLAKLRRPPAEAHSLETQSLLTQATYKAKPIYTTVSNISLYVRHALGPILVNSHGPTFESKTLHAG